MLCRSRTRKFQKSWRALFKKRGIDVNTSCKVEKIEKTETGVKVTWTDANGNAQMKEAEKVLVAVGRAPRTANVGVEKTKIELDRGFVKVNETQETAEPGIYAIGDIVVGIAATGPRRRHVRHCGREQKLPAASSVRSAATASPAPPTASRRSAPPA